VNCLVLLTSRFAYVCYHNAMKKSLYTGKGKTAGSLYSRLSGALKSCGIFVRVLAPFSLGFSENRQPAAGDAAAEGIPEPGAGVLNNKINIAIVGAKNLGVLLARELLSNPRAHYYPYCFIDSDVQKVGNMIAGIRVYPEKGIIERLRMMPVQEIIIAMPHLNGQQKMEKYEFYRQSDCKVKLYDFPFNQNDSNEGKRMLREFSIEDLLAREVIQFNDQESKHVYHGKTILVTGGGGSIGSELCRQLVKLEPEALIIFDIYENNAYDIEQELLPKLGKHIKLITEIGSVQDEDRLREVFEQHHPQIVFHAAAHKHVPMMERNSAEAVKNNVFGTLI
ncbi:MAG: polysaccharide biosynthesis protein, partial [Firmicutes bacterium]|nr:polysaccharide biosynthesis protein [Bacillota bacterium]